MYRKKDGLKLKSLMNITVTRNSEFWYGFIPLKTSMVSIYGTFVSSKLFLKTTAPYKTVSIKVSGI